MSALGRHILAEFYGCPPDYLNDLEKIRRKMVAAALEAGAEVKETVFHHFSPQGVSGVVVISESHLAIHTWPEFGYAAVDIFTCGQTVDPWISCDYLKQKLSAQNVTAREIERGIFDVSLQHKTVANY
ncbi:MAG TPA: S-adenosylmethionine decarboxylase proenzyme [Firmicutes bacterium]|jgi:S-adenosylmethionine decarboxylase|nr:S-adenosylmethionine decarboxylase proenzyme [Bacillota bacterium]